MRNRALSCGARDAADLARDYLDLIVGLDESAGGPCTVEVRPDADTLASVMQFFDTYNGQWTTGSASMLIPEMTICKDGRFHLVTKLAPEISPSIRLDGPNNSNQIAVFGKL